MPDLMAQGQAWLADQLKRYVSAKIVYQRGSATALLDATIGQTLFSLSDQFGGVIVERTDRDFIVPTADLILDGAVITPERGDKIREYVGNEVQVFEVLAPGGEQPYREDPHRKTTRIHAKRVARAE